MCVCVCVCVCVRACVHSVMSYSLDCAHQAPLSMEFSRQEYCSGLPFPPPGDVLDPGIKSASLLSPALADEFFTAGASWEAPFVSPNKKQNPYVEIIISYIMILGS